MVKLRCPDEPLHVHEPRSMRELLRAAEIRFSTAPSRIDPRRRPRVQGLPPRRCWHHDRCTSDSCRLVTLAKAAESSQERKLRARPGGKVRSWPRPADFGEEKIGSYWGPSTVEPTEPRRRPVPGATPVDR